METAWKKTFSKIKMKKIRILYIGISDYLDLDFLLGLKQQDFDQRIMVKLLTHKTVISKSWSVADIFNRIIQVRIIQSVS